MRPVLRPGLRMVRAPSGSPALVEHDRVYPLDETTAGLLDRLDGMADETGVLGDAPHHGTATAWRRLRAAGIVVDLEAPARMVRDLEQARRPAALHEAAALVAHEPATAERSWTLRLRCTVAVTGHGAVTDRLVTLLGQAGVRTVLDGSPDSAADVTVLTHDHEPPADALEALLRAGRCHLPAGMRGTAGLVGPFVVPGTTPCLRCVDLTRCQTDRAWGVLRDRLSAPAGGRTAGTPASGVVTGAVAALAASEVLARVEGRVPATVGATATVSLHRPLPTLRSWPVQPGCGCAWDSCLDGRGQ